jgi:cytochrome c oxidase subunit 4
MSAEHHSSAPGKRHKVEGPFNHYLTYMVSILLTIFAFAAVIYGGLDKVFLFLFLVVLAIVQSVFQLLVWMHGKEKGHVYALIGISFGGIIALTAVAAAEFWMWW